MQIKVKGQTCDIVSVTQLREDKAHSEHQSQVESCSYLHLERTCVCVTLTLFTVRQRKESQ